MGAVMIISFLNQKGGVGKTTLALHVAVALQMQERGRGLVIDADPQGSALDWQAQRAAASPVPVVGMPTPTLHRDAPAIADTDYLVIDGPPRMDVMAKSAIAASDLVCIPVQPSPLDVWAAREIFDLVDECRVLKPSLIVRFVINRAVQRTVLAAEVESALAEFKTPLLPVVRNRTEYAKAIRTGQTAMETQPHGQAARDIKVLADAVWDTAQGGSHVGLGREAALDDADA